MTDQSTDQTFRVDDILAAFSLLSRIPVPVDHGLAGQRASNATWAYPVVGATLGGIAGLIANAALFLGAPAGIAAALALATLAVLSGAMHEDGLADCADGLGGGHDKANRLAIMKDSQIGAYGGVALGIALIARWSGIEALIETGGLFWPLVAVGAASRAPMVAAMFFMKPAKDDGLSATVGLPPPAALAASVGIALAICMFCLSWGGVALMFWVYVAALPLLVLANALIGGQTGDILGGSQQLAEIAGLAVVVAILI